MSMRSRRWWLTVCGVLTIGSLAWAAGFPLTETKEQLGLDYQVTAVARGQSVTVTLTISSQGKLKPLQSVILAVPGENKGDPYDVYLPLAIQQKEGKLTAWAQLSRTLAERATIELVPENPPEKVLGWVFHGIPVRGYIEDAK